MHHMAWCCLVRYRRSYHGDGAVASKFRPILRHTRSVPQHSRSDEQRQSDAQSDVQGRKQAMIASEFRDFIIESTVFYDNYATRVHEISYVYIDKLHFC